MYLHSCVSTLSPSMPSSFWKIPLGSECSSSRHRDSTSPLFRLCVMWGMRILSLIGRLLAVCWRNCLLLEVIFSCAVGMALRRLFSATRVTSGRSEKAVFQRFFCFFFYRGSCFNLDIYSESIFSVPRLFDFRRTINSQEFLKRSVMPLCFNGIFWSFASRILIRIKVTFDIWC